MAQSSGTTGDNKGPEAYRTISEVAGELDLPQHVLRFWETRFGQIKPLKRAGGRRFYRPQDVDLLRGVRHLLYEEGLTIRGVQKVLREQGPRHVAAIGRGQGEMSEDEEAPPPRLKPARFRDSSEEVQAFFPFPDAPHDAQPGQAADGSRTPTLKSTADDDVEFPDLAAGRKREASFPKAARRRDRPDAEPPASLRLPKQIDEHDDGEAEAPEDALADPSLDPLPKGILPEDELPTYGGDEEQAGGFRFFDRLKRDPAHAKGGAGDLSREDVRDLQAALFELLECKRLLDRSR